MKRIILLLALALSLSTFLFSCDNTPSYDNALSLIERGKYEEAYEMLKTIDTEEARELLEDFYFLPVSSTKIFDGEIQILKIKLGSNGLPKKMRYYSTDFETCVFKYTYRDNDRFISIKQIENVTGGVTVIEYKYNEDGNLIKETSVYEDSDKYVAEYFYNDNRDLIKTIEIDNSGNCIVWEYTYDANGNIVRSAEDYTASEHFDNHRWIAYIDYTYDANGNLVKKTYKTDVIKESSRNDYPFDVEPSYLECVDYVYDDNGNMVSETSTYNNGVEVREYIYNEHGQLIKETFNSDIKDSFIGTDGSYSYSEYTYNENGYLVRDEYTSVTGGYSIVDEYTYDEYGNIIKYMIDYGDGDGETITVKYKLIYNSGEGVKGYLEKVYEEIFSKG